MKPTCPQCRIGVGRLVSIVQGSKTYRFDCCSPTPAVESPEPNPQSKPLKQSKRRYPRPQIEPPPRRKTALPFRPDNLEHALDMLGVLGEAVNASQIATIDE
jgi:hypothetical protein